MDKFKLKQEAKSLLLKGCFKMACNKYSQLIQLGSQGFSKREWVVIHLNQAISHQNLDQFNPALELCNRSIEIDPTYQKAYYRRIQILREMNELESAIKSVPSWIHNEQIDNLLKETQEQHLNSLGMDSLLSDLMEGRQTNIDLIRHSHGKFYHKVLQQGEKKVQPQSVKTLGSKIGEYYCCLKERKQKQSLQSFLSILHMLILKTHEEQTLKDFVQLLLEDFWKQFLQQAEPFLIEEISIEMVKGGEEFKLAKFAPSSPQIIQYLTKLVTHPSLSSEELFEASIQTANNLCSKPFSNSFGPQIYALLSILIDSLSTKMTHSKLNWLKRSFLLLDTLVKLHLHYQPSFKVAEVSLTNLVYVRYYHINSKPTEQSWLKVSDTSIRDLLISNLNNFFVIYIVQQIIHKLDRTILKQAIPAIEDELDLLLDLKNTKSLSPSYLQMQKEYQLIYTSLMLKLDLKHASTRIDISALLSHKHNRKTIYDTSLSDIIINALLLLGLSNKQNLIEILKHPHTITNILHQYIDDSFKQQLQNLGTTTSFIYIAAVNVEHEQQENYAKKMGVSPQQIEKARKLQGEVDDSKVSAELGKKRQQFVEYIAKHLHQTIVNLSSILLKIKEDVSLSKWSKIVNEVAKVDPTRLHHPKIIQIMLESFKVQKEVVGQFFSLLCKKINVNLLKYQQTQSIVDILVYNLQNGQHELVIFQSLLGLINLTSNSNNKLRIPIKALQNSLFEENKYIVHGALELLNNVLVQCDREEIEKMDKLKEIIEKYIRFYREEIVNYQEKMPLTDYSHPSRVYSTLLSVAIVIDFDQLEEFQEWSNAEKYLLRIETSREITFFKVAIYMGMKDRLKGKWWSKFEKELAALEQSNKPFWVKLKQYMK